MLVRMARLNLGAGRVTACRMLCSAPRKTWDPNANVHGRAGAAAEVVSDDTSEIDEAPSTPRRARNYPRGAGAASSYLAARAGGGAARDTERSTGGRAEMLQFQSFVRQRLAQMAHRLPSTPSVRESAELAYLEEQVVEDHMPARRRRLRDPLKAVSKADITHTNLPLLSRFVSDNGALLPRKLTGVERHKQKLLGKAVKRAQQLALLPTIWKLPKYRHASYTDAYSRPERPLPQRYEGDEFPDPPDPRYPGVWDYAARSAAKADLGSLLRGGPAASPFGSSPLDTPADAPPDTPPAEK